MIAIYWFLVLVLIGQFFTNTEWKGFLLELDTIGNIIKTATAVNNNGWEGTLNSFAIGTDGSYIFTGYSSNYIIEYSSRIIGLFYKFNSFIYEKIIKDYTDFECSAHSTISTPDNGFIIGVECVTFDEIDTHLYLLKIDKNGDIIWENIIDEFLYDNKVISIVPLPNGNFLASCAVNWQPWEFSNPADILFLEFDTDGNIIHKNLFNWGISESIGDMSFCDDGTIIGNYELDDLNYVIRFDTSFNIVWISEMISEYGISNPTELSSGDIIVAGTIASNSLEAQVHLTKLSPQGNIIWQRLYGGEKNDYAYALATDPNGTFWVTGRWESGLQSIPLYNADSSVVMNGGTADILLLHTNCLGLLENPSLNFDLNIDNHAVYFTADSLGFRGEPILDLRWDFGDGTSAPAQFGQTVVHTYPNNGTYWATLNAYFCDTLSVGQCVQINTSETCPENWVLGNEQMPPLHNNLPVSYIAQENALHFWAELQQAQLQIVDTQGRVILQSQCSGSQFSLPQQLPVGVYFYQIFDQHRQNKLAYGKFFVP
ncbi:MAG: PKD domain-containing protein [Chitinophagales bacterium]